MSTPERLLRLLRERGLPEITTLTPTDAGESGSAFKATDRAEKESIVKFLPASGSDAHGQLDGLDTTVRRLRTARLVVADFVSSGVVISPGGTKRPRRRSGPR